MKQEFEWADVERCLPPEGVEVLVVDGNGDVRTGAMRYERCLCAEGGCGTEDSDHPYEWPSWWRGKAQYRRVTHWAYLPLSPKRLAEVTP
jgi:hypothetical protein